MEELERVFTFPILEKEDSGNMLHETMRRTLGEIAREVAEKSSQTE
jgi:hypothetical protein